MTETTTPAPGHPFDPDAPKRVRAWIEQYENRPHSDTLVFAGAAAAFIADLRETFRQFDYAKETREELADASANWRHKYEEQHLRADRLESEKTALGQTVAALPDATANAAANLAHARAERDRLGKQVKDITHAVSHMLPSADDPAAPDPGDHWRQVHHRLVTEVARIIDPNRASR